MGVNMFTVKANRGSSKFEQSFTNFAEANEKSKWLVKNGFVAEVIRPHARS